MLFRSLAYCLTFYPLLSYPHFQRSMFPVLKFIFELLQFSRSKVKGLQLGVEVGGLGVSGLEEAGGMAEIYRYHCCQLTLLINGEDREVRAMFEAYRARLVQSVLAVFDEVYLNLTHQKRGFDCEVREWSSQAVVDSVLRRPPRDLLDLRKVKRVCSACACVEGGDW